LFATVSGFDFGFWFFMVLGFVPWGRVLFCVRRRIFRGRYRADGFNFVFHIMANQQVSFYCCKSVVQVRIMAHSAEESGCDVFSICESEGRWYVWYKFSDPRTADGISTIFNKMWADYERAERAAARKVRKTSKPDES